MRDFEARNSKFELKRLSLRPKKLIFSLAALWGGRTNETNWKYENALTLLDHIKKRNKMDVFYGFELGNEIYGSHGHAAQIKPDIARVSA